MFENMSDDVLIQEIGKGSDEDGRAFTAREAAKAELTKRLLYSMRDLNKSTRYYSKWLIGLTITLGILAAVQIGIGIYQIING